MSHPYSPADAIVPNFVPNSKTDLDLLLTFAAAWIPILLGTWMFTAWYSPKIKKLDQLIILWFMLCGTLHTFFEGFYVLNHATIGSSTHIFAQLWKEYALSDSRYLTSDIFVLAAEGTTVLILGPLSYLTAYLIATGSPYRMSVQVMICFGHMYSDTLYYATSLLDYYVRGVDHCRPEAYYFWVYYICMNFVWIIVPGLLLMQAVSKTSRAFKALNRMARSIQGDTRQTRANGKLTDTR